MTSTRNSWLLFALAVACVGCGGGGGTSVTGPTSSTITAPPPSAGPPAGTSRWNFTYQAASAHTCPSAPQTPDDGGAVTLTVATDGRTLTLVGVAPPTLTVGTVNSDGAGGWSAQRGNITLAFRFSSATRADGTVVAANAIFTGGPPCSATWPIVLDR